MVIGKFIIGIIGIIGIIDIIYNVLSNTKYINMLTRTGNTC